MYLRHGSFLRTGIACDSLIGMCTTVELLDDAMDISVTIRRDGVRPHEHRTLIDKGSGMGINAVNKLVHGYMT